MNTELAIKTLNEALIEEKRPKNLILHSDQVVQFTSWEFVKFCKDNNASNFLKSMMSLADANPIMCSASCSFSLFLIFLKSTPP